MNIGNASQNPDPRNHGKTSGKPTFSVEARLLTPENMEKLMEDQYFRLQTKILTPEKP